MTTKNGFVMLGMVAILMSTAVMCGCTDDSKDSEPTETTILDETKTVDAGSYSGYKIDTIEGRTYTVSLKTDGSPIDLLLLDDVDYENYQSCVKGDSVAFAYYLAGSAMSCAGKTYSFDGDGNSYHVIFDNTYVPDDGADAGVAVNVHVVITASE